MEVNNSIDLLIDAPFDLVDWKIDHSKREDVIIVKHLVVAKELKNRKK